MLKKAIVLLLIFSLNAQVFSQMGLFAYFVLNNDYVANVLCENKNRPEIYCNGQCFLTKNLKSIQTEERRQLANLLITEAVTFFYQIWVSFDFQPFGEISLQKTTPFYHFQVTESVGFSIFHPPQA